MHRETFIARLTEVQQIVEQLLAQVQASEHDAFAAHIYRSRREYRLVCQRAGKEGKQIITYYGLEYDLRFFTKTLCCGERPGGAFEDRVNFAVKVYTNFFLAIQRKSSHKSF